MRLATQIQSTQVVSGPLMVQTDNSALGRVANESTITGLPLVTRNFAQIAGLSPGVAVGVYNAGELGLGGTALSQIAASNDGIFVHGARSYDNNFLLDGISVSDVQGSGSGSGGIPLPNPDSLQEFKVQTGQYDAGYGRYAGANVSLVTKTGANTFDGNIFEFFRNKVLNRRTNRSHLFSRDSPSSPSHATSVRTSFWRTWSTFPPRPANTTFGSLLRLTIRPLHFLATALIPSATYPDF